MTDGIAWADLDEKEWLERAETQLWTGPWRSTMPERIQMQASKDWRMPPGSVYVGRPTKWGNPWQHGVPGRYHGDICMGLLNGYLTRSNAVLLYAEWLKVSDPRVLLLLPPMTLAGYRLERCYLATRRQVILDSLGDLRGRDLACWCPLGAPCHADVLLAMANA